MATPKPETETAPSIRDRIRELRRVRADELLPNPKNWRRHPEAQTAILSGLLEEIGYADALIARETDDGLMLIDGHLRAGVSGSDEVPVLVVDLDEAEADKLLASLDPLAALAETDSDALRDLLATVESENEDVSDFLNSMLALRIPPELPPQEPPPRAERMVEIFCSSADYAALEPALDKWRATRPNVSINVS